MKAFIPFLAVLILASCSKDNDTKPSGASGLTGDAKDVYEIVWGKQAPDGNYLLIDKTSEFINATNDNIESFKVETVKPYQGTGQFEGKGISISGEGHEIRIVKHETAANILVVRCYLGGVEVMSRSYPY